MIRSLSLVLLSLVLVLPSCGTFSNLSDGIAKGREVVADLQKGYEELKPLVKELMDGGKDIAGDVAGALAYYETLRKDITREMDELKSELKALDKEAFKKADKDGDGDLDWIERLAYLLLLGGGSLEIGRRKLKQLKEQASGASGGEAPPAA